MNSLDEYALIVLLALAGYLLHHYWRKWNPRVEDDGTASYDSEIDKLLHGEEFKVKGRYEQ